MKKVPRYRIVIATDIGVNRFVPEENEDRMFTMIQHRTGLDRPIAEAILQSGKPIVLADARIEYVRPS